MCKFLAERAWVHALGSYLCHSDRQRKVKEGSENEVNIIPCEISLQHDSKQFR
jgi:hypothetical protein